MTNPPTIAEIRERFAAKALEKRELLSCRSVPTGIPRGVICEISGNARTEWLVSLLSEHPSLKTFWCEEKLSLLPTAIQQRGVDLSHVLIAEAGAQVFQATRKALKSKLFDCLILQGEAKGMQEVKMLKALQLFARESNACVFFLSQKPKSAWAIHFQLQATWSENGDYEVGVLKSKNSGRIGS